jgi:apolipoprotein N-acyltransferase
VRKALTATRADLLALLAGALLPLAFAPLSLFPIAVLSPALLFLLWLDVTPRRALWRGLLFGLGQFGVGVSWVYVAIHDFGHSGVPLAVFLTTLFVGTLALFPALLGYFAVRFVRGPEWLRLTLLFPAAWTLFEWLRGWVLTGFPWLNLGYSQIDAPLRGFAPLAGVYGVTLAVTVSAGLVAVLVLSGRRTDPRALAGRAWLAGALLMRVNWTEASSTPLRVSLVQGNIPQDTKWRPELVQHTLDLYADLTRQHWDSRLILWPEAAVTVFHHEVAGDYLPGLAREARAHGSDIVLGIPVREPGTRRYYNSLLALSDNPGFITAPPHAIRRLPAARGISARSDSLLRFAHVRFQRRSGPAAVAAGGRPENRKRHLLRGYLWRGAHRRVARGHVAGQRHQQCLVREFLRSAPASRNVAPARARDRPLYAAGHYQRRLGNH